MLTGGAYTNTKKWTELIHYGPLFTSDYKYQKLPIKYNFEKNNSEEIILSPLAEEYAYYYAKLPPNEFQTEIRNRNFWNDFKVMLPQHLQNASLDQFDFTNLLNYDSPKQSYDEKYKFVYKDGEKFSIGQVFVEPPGIFMGRGVHPLTGKIRQRILPKDITINTSEPEKFLGGGWANVISDPTLAWTSSWKDNVTQKTKYIMPQFHLNDKQKFDLAQTLNPQKLRTMYQKDLISNDIQKKQLATALSFIDYLSLRIGNTKYDDEAETQGATTLQSKNIMLQDNNYALINFMGKDSLEYKNRVQLTPQIYQNVKEFQDQKSKEDLLFDQIDAQLLNEYLKTLMPNLTSKVWRTHNACKLFQSELQKNPTLEGFKAANEKVAKMCNHIANGKLNLGTSLGNYIDPRIIISFAARKNFDLEQLVTKNQAQKYEWAKKHTNFIF